MSWFLRGNSRRFFRVDMPVRFFMLPKDQRSYHDVFCNGVSYMNEAFENQSSKLKSQVQFNVRQLQANQKAMNAIAFEVIELVEAVSDMMELHSKGERVIDNPSYWFSKSTIMEGFKSIHALKQSAPKTFTILEKLEEKFLSRIGSLFKSFERSTQTEVYSEHIAHGFGIDAIIEKMRTSEKNHKIPMARFLFSLYDYVDTLNRVYEHFSNDHLLANEPKYWSLNNANISACGMGVYDFRQFEKYELLHVKVYCPDVGETFQFEGKVISSRYDKQKNLNFNAIEFMFPDERQQLGLLSYIQLHESINAMKKVKNAGY